MWLYLLCLHLYQEVELVGLGEVVLCHLSAVKYAIEIKKANELLEDVMSYRPISCPDVYAKIESVRKLLI